MNISLMDVDASPSPRVMYRALLDRDPSFEGLFFVGVKTTGIFCRPTCPARKPHAENVEFFPDSGAAIKAGYRACLRCRPMEASSAQPEWFEPLVRKVESDPGKRITNRMLTGMGVSPLAARRYFRQRFGMTFQGYQRARRLGLAAHALNAAPGRSSRSLSRAISRSGFRSESGFRSAFAQLFGTSPGRALRSGRAPLWVTWLETPLGVMLAGATDTALGFLDFADRPALLTQSRTLAARFSDHLIVPGTSPVHERLRAQLDAYFARSLRSFTIPMDIRGTPFQEAVWRALLAIPAGTTRSYADIARIVGSPGAVRAVGQANGANRIAILIPCHRVIDSSGNLHGYGGGLWRKRYLLELEGLRPASRPAIPCRA